MKRLVFYTKDLRLKVREAFPDDDFSRPCKWNDNLEFIVTESGDFTMVWTSLLPDLDPVYAETLLDLVAARFPVSPQHQLLLETCEEMSFQNKSLEWVFYGGSFNPWHQGHQACLNLLPEDKTCLVTPDRNPEKDIRDVRPVSSILEISTKAKFKANQFLVPSFLLENKKNPTVEWVLRMKEEYPSYQISLLMGFDSFAAIKTWIRSDELLPKLHTIYVVSRLEEDEDRRLALDEAHALGPHLNVVFLGKHHYEGISSTDIRNRK